MTQITIDTAVLEHVLEWFEWFHNAPNLISKHSSNRVHDGLREALAAAVPVQEPVGFVVATRWNADGITTRHAASFRENANVKAGDMLYTSPQAQPISDERLCEAMRKAADELLRLEAANSELLESLISIAEDSSDEGARECAMDAIAKHGGAA